MRPYSEEITLQMSGPECCSNAPILNPNYGVGHVEKLGGLDTYVTGP
ncbi:endo-13-14-beta-D-glucanase-like protein, partial [Trifolium medium]|nr:endo-13-14-beta-D-glucanase-like protein [Trifolium medium]